LKAAIVASKRAFSSGVCCGKAGGGGAQDAVHDHSLQDFMIACAGCAADDLSDNSLTEEATPRQGGFTNGYSP
jgi:hypothetical protein